MQSELSQRMSQSESPRRQGEHGDRDTVIRNIEPVQNRHSTSQPGTKFGDIPDVRQDVPSSPLGPPKAEHRSTGALEARYCEVSGCDQKAYGFWYYGDIHRCAEHALEWIAEQKKL
ncbi:hypothetical protein MKUB_45730 [Mycobacterium kubicae]|uniref:Uncharacterized protein n=2 Tax=Mycobacterium kubicae TaxID=120959 RepID=A0ABQ1BU21_9MYCO|nr:hypothetical protein MKUB_45730 [Mycobacterium kubicae]